MIESHKSNELTTTDQLISSLLFFAPWFAYFIMAFPLTIYFLIRFWRATEGAAEYMLLAIVSFAVGSALGILAVIALLIFRWYWEKNLRNKIASDGITANELSWFKSELTKSERRALKEIERQHPLLADAYRETLASRLTATRLISRVEKDMVQIERRLKRTQRLRTTEADQLNEELKMDRNRLIEIKREAKKRLIETETRLQTIEATANRSLTQNEMSIALKRLEASQNQLPYALEAAKIEQQTLEEIEKELRDINKKEEPLQLEEGTPKTENK
jgi:hypothetical protein